MYPSILRSVCPLLLSLLLIGCGGSGSARDGAPNVVTAEDISRETPTATRLADLIEGRIPGVSISQAAGGRVVIRMRGVSTFSGADQPLVVVDDVPVALNADGSIPGVAVSEIVSIKVLKDLTETSRYGMRGAFGVIVVTTRRGLDR